MNTELLIAFGLLAIMLIWVIAKVVGYARKSEQQWQQVDKTKLQKWEDDDD